MTLWTDGRTLRTRPPRILRGHVPSRVDRRRGSRREHADLIYVHPFPAAVEETSPITFGRRRPEGADACCLAARCWGVGATHQGRRAVAEARREVLRRERRPRAPRDRGRERRGQERRQRLVSWAISNHECTRPSSARRRGWPTSTAVFDAEANIRFAAYMSRGGEDWSSWSVKP